MFSIPYFVVLINIYPSIVTIIHRILTYFRRNISLKHMFFEELRNISNKKSNSSCKSPIRPRCVRTNRDERELTNHHVSARIKLRRVYTTTHGTTSRRLYLELKTVCKSVLGPPFQAQISGALIPYTKDCFNTR